MRARNIKPDFFKNDELAELPFSTRLLFIGLWCYADREGFFESKIKRIKAEIYPYDEDKKLVPLDEALVTLATSGFIQIYHPTDQTIDRYGKHVENSIVKIVNFSKHQRPHQNEKDSIYKDIIKTCFLGNNYLSPRKQALGPERGMMNDDILNEERGNRTENNNADPAGRRPETPKDKKKGKGKKIYSTAVSAYRDIFKLTPKPDERQIIDLVINGQRSVAKWSEIMFEWKRRKYGPFNITGMLHVFKKGWIGDAEPKRPTGTNAVLEWAKNEGVSLDGEQTNIEQGYADSNAGIPF